MQRKHNIFHLSIKISFQCRSFSIRFILTSEPLSKYINSENTAFINFNIVDIIPDRQYLGNIYYLFTQNDIYSSGVRSSLLPDQHNRCAGLSNAPARVQGVAARRRLPRAQCLSGKGQELQHYYLNVQQLIYKDSKITKIFPLSPTLSLSCVQTVQTETDASQVQPVKNIQWFVLGTVVLTAALVGVSAWKSWM
ncbi:Hypothetical_protein [Hexamita inflata]|uniref:Hypothetical_protein n=1 Tax=Hexamita inflata TaxID=28002 RepID=A0AA86R0C2_9EUKA|nr:Hypothetical protein HINF_LOCUS55490 [Hexamita inflata]